MLMRIRLAAPTVLTAALAASLAAQAPTAAPTVATDVGRSVYTRNCAACHGADLQGGTAGAMTGEDFRTRWSAPGRSFDDLYSLIRTTMPRGREGSLTADEYRAVTTYVLERNGLLGASAAGASPTAQAAPTTPWNIRRIVPDYLEGPRGRTPTGTGPSQAELLAAESDPRDWLTHTRDLAGTRYSPLRQITTRNVGRLRVACSFQVGEAGSFQPGPVVHQGTMYLTTTWSTIALDAATCRPKWRHDWEHSMTGSGPYRGVAIKDGRVVRGTGDGYLLALDAADGTLLWSRRIADANIGERITMPPIIHEDLIYIGPAVSENAIRGWVGAFRLDDGAPVWRFNIVPAPGEPGYETWKHDNPFPVGGGGVWTPFSIDAARGLLHVAATNPAPDFPEELRGGTNLYTNSALALDLRTGKLVWYDQMVPNDDHDWDLTQVSPLYRATVDGRPRDLMATVGKDGILRVVDRESRQRLFATPVTTIENADAEVTREGTHACPGVLGGVEWNGPAYHPGANVLVTPAVDWCYTFFEAETITFVPGQNYLGGKVVADSTAQGWVTAIDASTGALRWRYRSPRPVVAAVTATGGGLIFAGELSGDLIALDARTGTVRYRHNTGGSVGGGIITYEVDGTQYVAVASGRPSGFWIDAFPGASTITVFALDGGPAMRR